MTATLATSPPSSCARRKYAASASAGGVSSKLWYEQTSPIPWRRDVAHRADPRRLVAHLIVDEVDAIGLADGDVHVHHCLLADLDALSAFPQRATREEKRQAGQLLPQRKRRFDYRVRIVDRAEVVHAPLDDVGRRTAHRGRLRQQGVAARADERHAEERHAALRRGAAANHDRLHAGHLTGVRRRSAGSAPPSALRRPPGR
jgi:hypothetical protein